MHFFSHGFSRFALVFLASGSTALALPACSSNDGQSVAEDTKVAIKDWAARRADAQCGATQPCCDAAKLPYDEGQCRSSLASFNWANAQELLAAGAVFDSALAEQCIAETIALDCRTRSSDPAACTLALRGSTPPLGDCLTDRDCAPTEEGFSHCGSAQRCETLLAEGTIGAPCSTADTLGNIYECGPGLTCDYAIGQCAPLAEPGSTCDSGDCVEEAYCNTSPSEPSTWTCQLLAQVGDDCSEKPCVPSAACASGKCQLKLPSTAPCTQSAQCQSNFCSGDTGRCGFYDWCVAP